MIFVTVGSDIPFDRLLKAVDSWARAGKRTDVFAQVGRNAWQPESIPFTAMLSPAEFRVRIESCSVVVGHAGMGTILSALRYSKPVLVMPRRLHLHETRNDHQMATARHLSAMGKINVAFDEVELVEKLDHVLELEAKDAISPHAGGQLIATLKNFIHQS